VIFRILIVLLPSIALGFIWGCGTNAPNTKDDQVSVGLLADKPVLYAFQKGLLLELPSRKILRSGLPTVERAAHAWFYDFGDWQAVLSSRGDLYRSSNGAKWSHDAHGKDVNILGHHQMSDGQHLIYRADSRLFLVTQASTSPLVLENIGVPTVNGDYVTWLQYEDGAYRMNLTSFERARILTWSEVMDAVANVSELNGISSSEDSVRFILSESRIWSNGPVVWLKCASGIRKWSAGAWLSLSDVNGDAIQLSDGTLLAYNYEGEGEIVHYTNRGQRLVTRTPPGIIHFASVLNADAQGSVLLVGKAMGKYQVFMVDVSNGEMSRKWQWDSRGTLFSRHLAIATGDLVIPSAYGGVLVAVGETE